MITVDDDETLSEYHPYSTKFKNWLKKPMVYKIGHIIIPIYKRWHMIAFVSLIVLIIILLLLIFVPRKDNKVLQPFSVSTVK